jgi:hypothetical protein
MAVPCCCLAMATVEFQPLRDPDRSHTMATVKMIAVALGVPSGWYKRSVSTNVGAGTRTNVSRFAAFCLESDILDACFQRETWHSRHVRAEPTGIIVDVDVGPVE